MTVATIRNNNEKVLKKTTTTTTTKVKKRFDTKVLSGQIIWDSLPEAKRKFLKVNLRF